MKKAIFSIISAITALSIFTSCSPSADVNVSNDSSSRNNSSSSSNSNDESISIDDATNLEDLYSNIEEAYVKSYSANEIKSTYAAMCNKLNESATSAENSHNDTRQSIALFASDETNDKEDDDKGDKTFNPADFPIDVPTDIVQYFYILKDYTENDFEKFCNDYAAIGENTLARVRINDSLQELELSVRIGNTYVFYSNYYVNDKAQKHIRYEEGDYLYVEYHKFTYTVTDNKVSLPITYERNWQGNSQNYFVNGEDDFELLDITEAYDTLKYPFIKHIDSKLILSLLNSNSATIEDEMQFRQAIDKTLYNFNYVGEFNLEGLNFFGGEIKGIVDDDKLILSTDKYYVKTVSPNVFYISNGGLYLKFGVNTVHRESFENEIKLTTDYVLNYYRIDTEIHRTDDGIYFDLKAEIDLTKPNHSESFHDESIYASDETYIPDEIIYDELDSEGNYSAKPYYVFSTKKNEFLIIVDSFCD